MPLIPSDEQERQNAWFTNITKYNQGFINDVKVWISEINKPRSEQTHDVERHQEVLSGEESGIHEAVERGQQQQSSQHDDQDDILPCDSISNLSSRKQGSKSNVSTTSSARLKAEAEIAALLARQSLLKDKHSLEEQEEKLR